MLTIKEYSDKITPYDLYYNIILSFVLESMRNNLNKPDTWKI